MKTKSTRRHELTKKQFDQIAHLLPGRPGHVGANAVCNHQFLNAVLWILKTGCPWRDLPERYGSWKNVHRRLTRWVKQGVWDRIVQYHQENNLSTDFVHIDSTVVRAHQHASGALKEYKEIEGYSDKSLFESSIGNKSPNFIGRSSGGLTTKIHCMVSTDGTLLGTSLSEGQVHDSRPAISLLSDVKARGVVGDRAYAGSNIVEYLEKAGIQAVIPPHQASKKGREYDKSIYKPRNVIERFFNRMKHFRALATRYFKRPDYYLAAFRWAATLVGPFAKPKVARAG